ncbi:MAG: hypothetical protein JWR26_3195 [Pedosphaera sp.]|nr:hypothetical protein [Pedosphaera sp.]
MNGKIDFMSVKATKGKTGPMSGLRSRSAPVIERAPLPIIEVQGNTHVVSHVNSAFCTLLGKTKGELIGKPFAEIVPGGEECLPILDRVYKTGEAVTHAREDDSEGNPAYWLYAMWPALDEDENPMGVIIQLTKAASFRQNITAINEALLLAGLRQHELTEAAETWNSQLQAEIADRKLAEAALLVAKDLLAGQAGELERLVVERTEKLRETVGELEAFSYSLAHDMRAPLRSMRGFSQSLLEDYAAALDAKGVDLLERIVRSSQRLDRLIMDVLSYSSLLGGHIEIVPIDLSRLMQDILDTYPDWQPPKAEIRIEGTLPKVLGNEAFLTQSISNLLSNAVKFVVKGTLPMVRVWSETRGNLMRLCFQDNGIGIAVEKHARVFRMFERLHPAKDYEGTGIGLTLARKAAERMGGEIGFKSESGKGSTFWIQLKLA